MSGKMIQGFTNFKPNELKEFYLSSGFGMTETDFKMIQEHFCYELRNPTETELRILDAYWSEEVRRTTAYTRLGKVDIHKNSIGAVKKSLEEYLALFNRHHKGRADKYPSLADMAAATAREFCARKENTGVLQGKIFLAADDKGKPAGVVLLPETDSAAQKIFAFQSVAITDEYTQKKKPFSSAAALSVLSLPREAGTGDPETGDAVFWIRGDCEKIRRLFSLPDFCKTVKKYARIAAGGVAVALGKLADGVDFCLELCDSPATDTFWQCITSSEPGGILAAVGKKAVKKAASAIEKSGLETLQVATVTNKGRLRIYAGGNLIADLPKAFVANFGAAQTASVTVYEKPSHYFSKIERTAKIAMRQGISPVSRYIETLSETAAQSVSVESVPFAGGEKSKLYSVAAAAFDPDLTAESPFLGGLYAVIAATAKAVVCGAAPSSVYLLTHGFYAKTKESAERFSKAVSGYLGAAAAAAGLSNCILASAETVSDGKDRHGLVCFSVAAGGAVKSQHKFTAAGQKIYRYRLAKDKDCVPEFSAVAEFLNLLYGETARGLVDFSTVCEGKYGIAKTVAESAADTEYGFCFEKCSEDLFLPATGDILFSTEKPDDYIGYELELVGEVTASKGFSFRN